MAKLKFFIENSSNQYVSFLGASAIKTLLSDCWLKIPMAEKVAIKEYLVNYLKSDMVLKQEKQVVKMMILLLAKIAKLAWLDDPDIKNGLVPELTKILLI